MEAGHWRHNLRQVDLNRDWGLFTQPETSAAAEQITALAESGRLYLHLDFHSTFKDVFYSQPREIPSSPADFTQRWMEGIRERLPDYAAKVSSSDKPTTTTSMHWANRTFGAPSITYEIGDNTDRVLLQRVAAHAAQEMMELMLERKDAE